MKKNKKRLHYAVTQKIWGSFKVLYQGETLINSNEAIELTEFYNGKNLKPVIYFPRDSGIEKLICKEEKTSFCPIKGIASYWSYKEATNCIWSYEKPIKEVSLIKGYYSFYEDKGFKIIRSQLFKRL